MISEENQYIKDLEKNFKDMNEFVEQLIKQIPLNNDEKNKENEKHQLDNEDYILIKKQLINGQIIGILLKNSIEFKQYTEFNKILSLLKVNNIIAGDKQLLNNIFDSIFLYLVKNKIRMSNDLQGIFKFLNMMDQNYLLKDLKPFLNELYIKIFNQPDNVKYIGISDLVLLATTFFINDEIALCNKIINQILDNNFIDELPSNKKINLLYMSTYFNEEAKLFTLSKKLKEVSNRIDNPEIMLYYAFKNKKKLYLKEYTSFEQFSKRLNGCNKMVAEKLFKLITEFKPEVQKYESINFVTYNSNSVFCDHDRKLLTKKNVYLNVIDKLTGKKTKELQLNVLYCNNCKRDFVDEGIIKKIDKSITLKETYKILNYNNLNDESDIAKLGYNTTLNRDERWTILRNKVIPAVGVKKVIAHIEFLIRINSAKKDKDYSRAIGEWSYDANRIKQNYKVR